MSATLFSLEQLAGWLTGGRLVGDARAQVQRVHTDSRSLVAGDLFVALRGERFDAHAFLSQAKEAGVAGALAEHGLAEAGLSGVQVPDSRRALGELARQWRLNWDGDAQRPLVAITGSNGKTTVTQMVASILRRHAPERALSTQGNLNNDIGVPLTLLRLRAEHTCAVVELGMNHPGEIGLLADMAQPTVALVNNAQREHQEFMASVEAVALENGSVFHALSAGGTAVFPAADPHAGLWRSLAKGRRVLTFGFEPHSDVRGQSQWKTDHWHVMVQTPQGPFECRLHIAGRHNVLNALAATACAQAGGVALDTIAQGLTVFEPVNGRSRTLSLADGSTWVDDTYNANPDSVRAAIDVLAELPGPRVLVLGDMGEVGDHGPEFHAEVGRYATEHGIEHVLCLGELSRHTASACPQARHYEQLGGLLSHLDELRPGLNSGLVKGSRFMKMERVLEHLQIPTTQGHAHAA